MWQQLLKFIGYEFFLQRQQEAMSYLLAKAELADSQLHSMGPHKQQSIVFDLYLPTNVFKAMGGLHTINLYMSILIMMTHHN